METPLIFAVAPAEVSDAGEIADVLCRSIVEVCGPDYQHNKDLLHSWTANKTPANMLEWMKRRNNRMLVARQVNDAKILGVGLIEIVESKKEANILLCYVHPNYLSRGVGTKILQDLESEAIRHGISQINLSSSLTAFNFYLDHGYAAIKLEHTQPIGIRMKKVTIGVG